jgi:hypothetical protein
MIIKPSIFATLIIIQAFSLDAEQVFYVCYAKNNSFSELKFSFERPPLWAEAYNPADGLDQELPSFTTKVELTFEDTNSRGFIDVTFEPGFNLNYAFISMWAKTPEGNLYLSLMEDPELNIAWGNGKVDAQILELVCEHFLQQDLDESSQIY